MKGYIQNTSPRWGHVLKRSVGPGAKIMLDDLYAQYGEKHGLKEGKEFISWLKEVKLKDKDRWQLVLDDNAEVSSEVVKRVDSSEVDPNVGSVKELSVEDVVRLSVRKAREFLPKMTDIKLLKQAENETRQLSGKDSLRKLLVKRIRELSLTRG